MTSPDHAKSIQAAARRRLLRGSFSLPAVLAVHNGSALAATSNNKSCAIKSIASDPASPPLPIVGTGTDGWTRAPYYLDQAATPKRWISYSDFVTIAASKGLGLSPPSGTNTGYVRVWSSGTWAFGTPTGTVSTTVSGSVALLFDNLGAAPNTVRIIGFIQPGTTTFATGTGVVTNSCWTSLQP